MAAHRDLDEAPTFDTSKIDPVWDGGPTIESKTGAAPVTSKQPAENNSTNPTSDTPHKTQNTDTLIKMDSTPKETGTGAQTVSNTKPLIGESRA